MCFETISLKSFRWNRVVAYSSLQPLWHSEILSSCGDSLSLNWLRGPQANRVLILAARIPYLPELEPLRCNSLSHLTCNRLALTAAVFIWIPSLNSQFEFLVWILSCQLFAPITRVCLALVDASKRARIFVPANWHHPKPNFLITLFHSSSNFNFLMSICLSVGVCVYWVAFDCA